jgi:hypoxanthine phosphoribosyltransferase
MGMANIQLKDRQFELFIAEEVILKAVDRVAEDINRDLKDKNPLFVCVLNGAFIFAADLMKRINVPCEIEFVRLKSYEGTKTTGKIREFQGFTGNVEDRNIVIIEDIIDTGRSMYYLLEKLKENHPASLKIATLLFKPDALQLDITPDYVALEIPNDFIVGYGLDYDGHGRNLKSIYKIKS